MKLNTITRAMAFTALTLVSHAALADLNPGNPDSVDFQAAITAEKNPCKLTVTAETGTSFTFTYSYTQADADGGALGTMTPEGQPVSILASVPVGCSFTALKLTQDHAPGSIKLNDMLAGIPTGNGGSIPYIIGLSDVHFYTNSEGTAGTAFGTMIRDGINRASSRTDVASGDMQLNSSASFALYGTDNSGIVQATSVISGGHMLSGTSGATDPNSVLTATQNSFGATRTTIQGIYKLPTNNSDPTVASTDNGYVTWYPTLLDGANAGASSKDTDNLYASARFTFAPVIALYPYSLTSKLPDPLTAYDTVSGGVSPITATMSVTFTAI